MKRKYFLPVMLIITLMAFGEHAYSQQIHRVRPEEADSLFAVKLQIPLARAHKIRQAYNFKRDEIIALMRDKNIDETTRRKRLDILMTERQQQLDAVLRQGIRDTMRARMGDQDKIAFQHQKAQQALQRAREDKVAHVRHADSNHSDTTKQVQSPIKTNHQ